MTDTRIEPVDPSLIAKSDTPARPKRQGNRFLQTTRRLFMNRGAGIGVIVIVLLFAFAFLGVLTGATFTEKIFAWNGLGAWFIDAVQANDINVVVTYTLYSAVVVLLAGFVSDVLNAVLDPRVRAQK